MSLKKKLAIMYKINAPKEIDKSEIKVPNHFPNMMPDIISRGDPNPSKDIQIIQNKKNINKFK